MHWEKVETSWHELEGSVKSRWSRLTDDDLKRADGRIEKVIGILQERYGMAREDALRQLETFADEVAERTENRRLFSQSPTAD